MKLLKSRFYRSYNRLIAILLSILGFASACEPATEEYGTPALDYGVPNAEFIVKGNVNSENGSNAIPNIRVVMEYDTSYTDANGNFEFRNNDFPEDQTYTLQFSDTDGEENGNYQTLDTLVEFKDTAINGVDGAWNEGETEKEMNVKLTPKE